MPQEIRVATGKLAFLRVHEVGSGFGPNSDFIDVEVVCGVQGKDGGFGCTLRNDNNQFATRACSTCCAMPSTKIQLSK
jgi:hypothetical protein